MATVVDENNGLKITVDTDIPAKADISHLTETYLPDKPNPYISESSKHKPASDSDTNSTLSSEEDEEAAEDNPDIHVLKDNQRTDHRIGYSDNKRCIKIAVEYPREIRFLQLVTRYSVNQKQAFNQHQMVIRKNLYEDRGSEMAYYSTEEQINNSKMAKEENESHDNPDPLSHLRFLNWKVDVSKQSQTGLPYYVQPGENHTGMGFNALKDDGQCISVMYDQPDILDIKTLDEWSDTVLAKDTAKFITFIIDTNPDNIENPVLGEIQWSRVGRPYIADEENGPLKKWKDIQTAEFDFFKQQDKDHSYVCDYKIKSVKAYESPRPLPDWVDTVLHRDALGKSFELGLQERDSSLRLS